MNSLQPASKQAALCNVVASAVSAMIGIGGKLSSLSQRYLECGLY